MHKSQEAFYLQCNFYFVLSHIRCAGSVVYEICAFKVLSRCKSRSLRLGNSYELAHKWIYLANTLKIAEHVLRFPNKLLSYLHSFKYSKNHVVISAEISSNFRAVVSTRIPPDIFLEFTQLFELVIHQILIILQEFLWALFQKCCCHSLRNIWWNAPGNFLWESSRNRMGIIGKFVLFAMRGFCRSNYLNLA